MIRIPRQVEDMDSVCFFFSPLTIKFSVYQHVKDWPLSQSDIYRVILYRLMDYREQDRVRTST